MRRRVAFAAAVGLVLALAMSACTNDRPSVTQTQRPAPFRTCPTTVGGGGPAASDGPALPAIALPCFTGGEAVHLDRLHGPIVINLWASWCGPCRGELPELQRFADLAGDRISVLGVVTGDTVPAAASLGEDLSITFPMLYDEDSELLHQLGRPGLPVSVLVDTSGAVRYVTPADASAILTVETLTELVRTKLGVEVP